MHQIKLGGVGPSVSELALGCMRLCNLDTKAAESLLRTAMDQGINFFDHADIYGKGGSESLFASALGMAPSLRGQIVIQTKCAIHDGMYDFSKEHILKSVECSLRRLQTDYIDILLLHRPDTLMEPEEVAEAFAALRQSGKVRYFGVSNQNAAQMALLQSALGEKLLVNQLQFGLAHTGIIDAGFNVNMKTRPGSYGMAASSNIAVSTGLPSRHGRRFNTAFSGAYFSIIQLIRSSTARWKRLPEKNKSLKARSQSVGFCAIRQIYSRSSAPPAGSICLRCAAHRTSH